MLSPATRLIIQSGLLVGVVLIGAWAATRLKPHSQHWTLGWIAGAGYLIALFFLELLPQLFQNPYESPWTASAWLMAGFLIQQALAPLTKGMEHAHPIPKIPPQNTQYSILPALYLHALIEGTLLNPLNNSNTWTTLIGLSLHKLPVAYVLTMALQNTSKRYLALLGFALMTPMGAWGLYGMAKINHELLIHNLKPLYAIASGGLLHIATTILLESAPAHRYRYQQWTALFIGILLASILCIGAHA